MTHGGKRPGSGRRKSALNKMTALAKRKALESGITPLEYMLNVMRNDRADTKRRDDMAKAAAPFVHSRAIEHTGRDGGPISTLDLTKATDEQLAALETVFGPLAESSDGDEGNQAGAGA